MWVPRVPPTLPLERAAAVVIHPYVGACVCVGVRGVDSNSVPWFSLSQPGRPKILKRTSQNGKEKQKRNKEK